MSTPPAAPRGTGDPVAPAPLPRSQQVAEQLVTHLVDGGVREVVLAPGSRSAPLAFALHAADAAGRLRLHVRIDERSAGFLALGLAVGSRRPVAVVTTSGTAVGNLLPAVMEAHHSGHPLIAVTADRPAALRGTGASQTTFQPDIFGVFATCTDLPPDVDAAALQDAVARACTAHGPTQLNLQLEAPLTPLASDPPPSAARPAVTPGPAAVEGGLDHVREPVTGHDAAGLLPGDDAAEPVRGDDAAELLPLGPRTVVVAGDDAGPAARLLAEAAGWPLLAEPTSGARTGPNALRTYRLLLRTALGEQVERVVVMGHPTLSRPVTDLVSRPDLQVLAVRGRTSGVATDPGRVARVLARPPRVEGRDDPSWLEQWTRADAAVSHALDAELRSGAGDLTALGVAGVVAESVTEGATLVVGSSNPIRDLDVMAAPWPPQQHRFVVAMRGLAGIDGVVSFAAGVTLGRPRASRSIAIMGDLTFLHDANGLTIGPGEPVPDLTIVVVNDDGGSIFATLEQGGPQYAGSFERIFGTPHGTDLGALCRARGIEHHRLTSTDALRSALAEPVTGVRVLEVPVARDTRRADAAHLTQIAQSIVESPEKPTPKP